jgi:NAD(P)H-dependent FMN reductase
LVAAPNVQGRPSAYTAAIRKGGKPVLNTKILVGSTRDGRAADIVTPWVQTRAEAQASLSVEVLDLREWDLPMFAETSQSVGDFHHPTYSQPLIRRWNDTVSAADAAIIITPEYNHSVPAVLKNALDSLFFSFALRNKPVGLVGYSGGSVGGARAVEHLAHVLIEAEAVPLRNTVLLPAVQQAFADGEPTNPASDTALEILLEDLDWWGHILADARPNSLPPGVLRMNQRMQHRSPAAK